MQGCQVPSVGRAHSAHQIRTYSDTFCYVLKLALGLNSKVQKDHFWTDLRGQLETASKPERNFFMKKKKKGTATQTGFTTATDEGLKSVRRHQDCHKDTYGHIFSKYFSCVRKV
jgi:hypothetical protein